MGQPRIHQGLLEGGGGVPRRPLRITEHLAKGGDGQVRSLRQKQDSPALWERHRPGAVRPDAGQRAEQRALAAARRPTHHHALPGVDVQGGRVEEAPSIRQAQMESVDDQGGARGRRHLDRPRRGRQLRGPDQLLLEADQPVDARRPLGDAGVGVDKPTERGLDLAEGEGGLGQPAQGDRARKEPRRRHEDGKDGRRLAVPRREEGQAALGLHQSPPGPPDVAEGDAQLLLLVRLAAIERDALGVLADADHAKPEVGIGALQIEVDADQAPTDEVGGDGSRRGIDDGHPYHVARDRQGNPR